MINRRTFLGAVGTTLAAVSSEAIQPIQTYYDSYEAFSESQELQAYISTIRRLVAECSNTTRHTRQQATVALCNTMHNLQQRIYPLPQNILAQLQRMQAEIHDIEAVKRYDLAWQHSTPSSLPVTRVPPLKTTIGALADEFRQQYGIHLLLPTAVPAATPITTGYFNNTFTSAIAEICERTNTVASAVNNWQVIRCNPVQLDQSVYYNKHLVGYTTANTDGSTHYTVFSDPQTPIVGLQQDTPLNVDTIASVDTPVDEDLAWASQLADTPEIRCCCDTIEAPFPNGYAHMQANTPIAAYIATNRISTLLHTAGMPEFQIIRTNYGSVDLHITPTATQTTIHYHSQLDSSSFNCSCPKCCSDYTPQLHNLAQNSIEYFDQAGVPMPPAMRRRTLKTSLAIANHNLVEIEDQLIQIPTTIRIHMYKTMQKVAMQATNSGIHLVPSR